MSADTVQTFPAVQVFLERAAASGGSGDLRDDDVPIVAETCRRLDGVALAIELAAGFVENVAWRAWRRSSTTVSACCGSRGAGRRLLASKRSTRSSPGATTDWPSVSASSCDGCPSSSGRSRSTPPGPSCSRAATPTRPSSRS